MSADELEEFATGLARMARDLLAQDSVQKTLDRVVVHAVELVDGCEAAGVMTVENQQVRTLATTSDLVRASDRIQGEVGEGPCFDAARTLEEVYRVADMTETVKRWPQYAPQARELGIGSMMGFLLYTEDDNLGALDLYSSTPNAFTQRSEHVGWLLASHSAVAFSSARTHAQLHTAMETRHNIGEAIGIVMERYKLDEDQAFAVLKKSSQDRNTKLREVVRVVTETGEIPGAKPRP
ncbi:antitermination regulator [Streptomyces abyssalis]|uniref:Antitermination regulator n=1 Tax=Streptomyces abyssalis TaxID=933944 RepID=A0A1E7JSF7_9ACTN|nr:GAF and ANTAR domain-containing protein [Streptomyces abyssalis]OEU91832.1 antitermination regulator [Streptomyces abyssalis]OEU94028.1 antitermination regulator [Streptomyces abyssalis]OEV29930.1 antitermination regulator [Streptomyces nanshensis]